MANALVFKHINQNMKELDEYIKESMGYSESALKVQTDLENFSNDQLRTLSKFFVSTAGRDSDYPQRQLSIHDVENVLVVKWNKYTSNHPQSIKKFGFPLTISRKIRENEGLASQLWYLFSHVGGIVARVESTTPSVTMAGISNYIKERLKQSEG